MTVAKARPGALVVGTAEDFQGLEAVSVIIADIDSLVDLTDRRHWYVACTRVRVSLFCCTSR